MPSRSLVEQYRSPVVGWTARPTQFRIPVANTPRFFPSGSNASTPARSVSLPQLAPSGCRLIHDCNPPCGLPIPSPLLLADPTETSIRLSSLLNTMSLVECPYPCGNSATTASGLPVALRSPVL